MRSIRSVALARITPVAVMALLIAGAAGTAAAVTRGQTVEGHAYATGGVTVSEMRQLAAERDRYGLWVTTAARDTGAFLSDVQVTIRDARRDVVLETTMTGPWLFIDLPRGRYTLEAMFQGQMLADDVQVAPNGTRQSILYFDSPARVSPDWKSPFASSPYER